VDLLPCCLPHRLDQPDLTDLLFRKLNKSPSTVEDPSYLALPLCIPKVKKITLHFPLGLEVTARNMKGVTIKDALEAIHKQFKKRVRLPSSSIPAREPYTSVPGLPRTCSNNTQPHFLRSNANSQLQQDDEFDKPYLAGFEWDPEEDYTRFIVHQTNTPTSSFTGDKSSKKKKKAAAEE
jgi:hypothetical protein